jgi:hypothetical protein
MGVSWQRIRSTSDWWTATDTSSQPSEAEYRTEHTKHSHTSRITDYASRIIPWRQEQ